MPQYKIGIDSYYPTTQIIDGKRRVKGTYHEEKSSIMQFATDREALDEANKWWKEEYVGFMKEVYVNEGNRIVAHHSNFHFVSQNKKLLREFK